MFVLIGGYFAFLLLYLWAQALYAWGKADVTALEKLFLSGHGEGASKLEGYVFGDTHRLASGRPGEDDVLHRLTTKRLGALLAKHPRDGIGDVALAAAVGAHDRGNPLVEGKLRPIGKRLKT